MGRPSIGIVCRSTLDLRQAMPDLTGMKPEAGQASDIDE